MRLDLVTNRLTGGVPLTEAVAAAAAGGIDAVNLREKDLPVAELLPLARKLRAITAAKGVKLLINDRVDVALAVGADGVHLGQNSWPVADARRLLGAKALIGVSTHDFDQAREAAAAGADYIYFGHVFPSRSKPGLPPRGLATLRELVRTLDIPVVAIGGIDAGNIEEVKKAGAAGAAMISGILGADDVGRAVIALRQLVDKE